MIARRIARFLSSPACGGGGSPRSGETEGGLCGSPPSASLTPFPRHRIAAGVISSFVLAFLAACSREQPHGWLGYAEGDNAFISAPQPGWVAHLHVQRGDAVKPGQLLFTLDDTREAAARDQAAAAIPQIRAQLKQAR